VEHFQQHSLESCFSDQVPTTLRHPYKTAVAQMNGELDTQCSYCASVFLAVN